MGMSTHVIGFKPPDAKWKKMKEARDACEEAGIDIPDDIDDFFDGEPPDDNGVEIWLEKEECCSEWDDGDMRAGFEIDVDKLPKDVKIIRVYNSY